MPENNSVPVAAQVAMVSKVVLPLLDKLGINVTVTTKKTGMMLDMRFVEPTDTGVPEGYVFGTDSPEAARQIVALRDKIEQYRREHPNLPIPDAY